MAITYSTAQQVDDFHFTGGISARRSEGGWAVAPFMEDSKLQEVAGFTDEQIGPLGPQMGVKILGCDEITFLDPEFPSRNWHTFYGAPKLKRQPADRWGMIGHGAATAGDTQFASRARFVAASIRATEIQLRTASTNYRAQLHFAIRQKHQVGKRFTNVQLLELHTTFHSLLTEMASVRDYLAQVVAIRLKAPEKVDALNRLEDWLDKAANATLKNDPAVALLLDAKNGPDPWLAHLTKYRNDLVHTEPMSTNSNSRWLKLLEAATPWGQAYRVEMAIEKTTGSPDTCDALDRFAGLHVQLGRLADALAQLSPYPAIPMEVNPL